MRIEIKLLNENAVIPQYQTKGAAGFDLHAAEACVIEPGKSALVGTGLAIAIEEGYELQIRPRSGLAAKNQISVLNSPGTVDSDYRGEIKVILVNHGNNTFDVKTGDRIAQGVVAQAIQAKFVVVEKLDETVRGSGGFGSTGI